MVVRGMQPLPDLVPDLRLQRIQCGFVLSLITDVKEVGRTSHPGSFSCWEAALYPWDPDVAKSPVCFPILSFGALRVLL